VAETTMIMTDERTKRLIEFIWCKEGSVLHSHLLSTCPQIVVCTQRLSNFVTARRTRPWWRCCNVSRSEGLLRTSVTSTKTPSCYFTHTRSAQRDPTGPLA